MRPAVPTTSPDVLAVLAQARWSTADDGPPPAVAGFVLSEFSPLVAAAAERCLESHFGAPPVAAGDRVAVLLISPQGDIGTARAVSDALDQGRRVPPLLFFQSNPNAVLGHIAARWALGGPVMSLGAGHGVPEADEGSQSLGDGGPLDAAALLLDDGDADLVLLLTARPGLATAALCAPPGQTAAVGAAPEALTNPPTPSAL